MDDKFNKYLEENSKDLTKSSFALFQKEAERLKDLYNQNKLEGTFSFNDNNYTTNIENFSGLNNGEIKRNLLGKIKLNSPEAARSYLVGLVKDFYIKNPTPIKETLSPVKLENSILKNRFNNDPNLFGSRYSGLDNTQRWNEYVIPELKNYINYYKGLQPGTERTNLAELEEINTLISQPNFDKSRVVSLMDKAGLNSENLFLSPEDQKLWEENKAKAETEAKTAAENKVKVDAAKTEEERITKFESDLKAKGLNEALIGQIGNAGYTNYDTGFKSTQPWLNDYLKTHPELTVLKNSSGKHIIIDNQGLFNKTFNDVNTPNLFGKVITSDINKGLYAESAESAQKYGRGSFGFGQEQLRGSGIENGLPKSMIFKINNLPPQYSGALAIEGSPEDVTGKTNVRDAFGNLDYYRHLQIVLPGNKVAHLYRNPDGTYSAPNSSDKLNLNIQDTNNYRNYTYRKPFDYKKLHLSKPREINSAEVEEILKGGKSGLVGGEQSSLLNWAYMNPNHKLTQDIYTMFPQYKKEGGQIKRMYVGGFIQKEAGKAKKPVEKKEEEKIVANPTILKGSRFKDTSLKGIADKVALVSNAGMFVPGVIGGVSGLVSTASEAVSDFSDGVDWGDIGNLALNLGLSGAAAIGLGGLGKTAKVAAKLTKMSDKYKNVDELINFAKKVGDTKNLEKLKELKESGVKVLDSATTEKGLMDFATSAIRKNKPAAMLIPTPKFVKNVGITSSIAGTALALPALQETARKIKEGQTLTTDDVAQLENLAFGLNMGVKGITKNIGKRFGTKIEGSANSIVGKIKGEEISLTGSEADKFINTSRNTKEVKQLLLDKYNAKNEVKATLKDIEGIKKNKAQGELVALGENDFYNPNQNIKFQERARKWAGNYYSTAETPKVEPVKVETPVVETPVVIKPKVETPVVTEPVKVETPINVPTEPKVTIPKPIVSNRPVSNGRHKSKNKGKTKKHEQGGVLKFQNASGSLPTIQDLKNKNFNLPNVPLVKTQWNEFPIVKLQNTMKMEMPKKTLPTTLNIPTISTGTIKTPKDNNLLSGFLNNLYKNKEMLVDTGMYLLANKFNDKNIRIQKEALSKSFMPYLDIPRVILNKSNPILTQYENAANNYQTMGNRIANATSDINKGIAVQLESTKKANETRLKGFDEYSQYLLNLKIQQANLDAARDEKLAQMNYTTLGTNRNIAQQIALLDSNKNIQSYMNTSNYVDALKQFAQKRRYENIFDKLTTNTPEDIKQAMTRYSNVASKNYQGEAEFNAWNKLLPEQKVGKTFEESDYYKRMMDQINPLKTKIEEYQNQRDIMQAKLARGIYAKGGSLTVGDRIKIEQEKGNQKKSLESLRNYYKRLMKNEEFLQKAMIKIFK